MEWITLQRMSKPAVFTVFLIIFFLFQITQIFENQISDCGNNTDNNSEVMLKFSKKSIKLYLFGRLIVGLARHNIRQRNAHKWCLNFFFSLDAYLYWLWSTPFEVCIFLFSHESNSTITNALQYRFVCLLAKSLKQKQLIFHITQISYWRTITLEY